MLSDPLYTDADPYKLVFVDPNEIKMRTERSARRRGWVEGGGWDRETTTFTSGFVPCAIHHHFGKDDSESEPTADIEIDWPPIEATFESISTHGYRSQRELLEKSPGVAWAGLNDSMHPLANEIGVDIGRNGEVLWNMCGQHRLSIAQVLTIEEVPVQVFRRHADWQDVRDRIRSGEPVPNHLQDHPDLQDLLESGCESESGNP